jgi:hypothetical protein
MDLAVARSEHIRSIMEAHRVNRRRRSQRLPPPQGRLPVRHYTSRELRRILVDDVVRRYFGADIDDERRYLAWLVAGVQHIARQERVRVDDVFADLDGEVKALCGVGLRRW